MFFQQIEGEAAILIENGVYKQVDLYRRGVELFAKLGGGFVRLMADGSTTKTKARLYAMSWEGPLYRSPLGHLLAQNVEGAAMLDSDKQAKLVAPKPEGA